MVITAKNSVRNRTFKRHLNTCSYTYQLVCSDEVIVYWIISLIMCDYLPLHQLQRFYTSTRRLVSSVGVSTLSLCGFYSHRLQQFISYLVLFLVLFYFTLKNHLFINHTYELTYFEAVVVMTFCINNYCEA